MILQQTLSRREKIMSTFAVIFLVGLVLFGYSTTVTSPAQASILHAQKIDQENVQRFEALTENFTHIQQKTDLIVSLSIKSKIRSIKECLLDAQLRQTGRQKVTAVEAYAGCEKLFIEAEDEVTHFTDEFSNLTQDIKQLKLQVDEYEKLIEETTKALRTKKEATVEFKHL